MAPRSHFILVHLLLISVFQRSDNRHVHHQVDGTFSKPGNPEVDDVFSRAPPASIQLCSEMEEQLTSLNTQLQETRAQKGQLDEEAFALRKEVQQLNLTLGTCSSALSFIAGSHQTQLQKEMSNLLEVVDGEPFQILKILALTRDLSTLQKQVERAAESDGNSTETTLLQRDLEQKRDELEAKKRLIDRNNTTFTLILQIISLQNKIWDLHQNGINRETALRPDRRILEIQAQLDGKISELRDEGDTLSDVLGLISVRDKITQLEKRLKILSEEARSKTDDAQKQYDQKFEELKAAILLLNTQKKNKELTDKIRRLQGELDQYENSIADSKETLESAVLEITESLEAEKRNESVLETKLERAGHATAKLILKILSIMDELREQQQTSTGRPRDILDLLQAYKHDNATAQTEIQNLQEKLRTCERRLGPEGRYKEIQTELEEKLTDLNRTGDFKAALVLRVTNLHGELKALEDQISTAVHPDGIFKLQRKLQEKREELDSRTADMLRLIASPRIILKIIELQKNIWVLQDKPNNETTGTIKELQNKVDGLISELDDKDQVRIIQVLKIMTLQNQVEYLQRLLANTETSRATQLTNELAAKESDLKQLVNELTENNQTNGNLILAITKLLNQLRKLETEKQTENKTTSAVITNLREQLNIKEKENQQHQAEIKALQNSLSETEAQCSQNESRIKELQDHLDTKIVELQSKSDSVTSLALQISTLTAQLEELSRQLTNSVSKSKFEEIERIMDEKNKELDNKTDELKQRSTQAQRLLQIIALQVEIERQANVAANDTDYAKIRALQDHLADLIDGIVDKNSENTKLMFQILAHQDELVRLKKQEKSQLEAQAERIKVLEDELEDVRYEIKNKTSMLNSSNRRTDDLTAQILELNRKIEPLEEEISDLKEAYAENHAELQERFNFTKNQLKEVELQLKQSDAKNFKLLMEIADLRVQLKKAQKEAAKRTERKNADLELRLKAQEEENRNLQGANKVLEQQVNQLKTCCNKGCEDVQRQLQQSREDAERFRWQLQEKDTELKQLQGDFEVQGREKNKLQEDYDDLLAKLKDAEDETIHPIQITMDPETAHPRISLSADKTEISTTGDVFHVQDNPDRFDVVLAVLGATGFSRGRIYWEVSVAQKNCYQIGMASGSAPRKGPLTFRPSNGFWTIIVNRQGEFTASDERRVPIQVRTQPLTLGVLVDYDKGKISFYDAGSKSHIYSFTGQRFTDKIYPFINYCVEGTEIPQPLVLVSPGPTDWIK